MLLEDLAIPLNYYVELRYGPYFCQPVIAGLGNDKIPFICTMDCICCKLEVVFSEVGPVWRCFMVAEKAVLEDDSQCGTVERQPCTTHSLSDVLGPATTAAPAPFPSISLCLGIGPASLDEHRVRFRLCAPPVPFPPAVAK